MHNLKLRAEFLAGTPKAAIEFQQAANAPTAEFLELTYPTTDLLRMLQETGRSDSRPVLLLGERGQGKSHLLATLHHALTHPQLVQPWLAQWAVRLGIPEVATIPLRTGMHVISETVHHQEFLHLWDRLFERHPHGQFVRGKWAALGDKKTPYPPKSLLVELVSQCPTALVLDEFQTWFDGLLDTETSKTKTWTFAFVQLLSEVANEHPDKLVFAVSIRNTASEAYGQLHRDNPVRIDFRGETAKADRQKLLLHRLFENRAQFSESEVEAIVSTAASEKLRLQHLPQGDSDRVLATFVGAWPFSPELLSVLEDQVLVATAAQETRDLIGMLALTFRSYGHLRPLLTVADLRVDDDESAVVKLIDAVATPMHQRLRNKALRNLQAVHESMPDWQSKLPMLPEFLTALWVRSIAVGNKVGAELHELQLDLTRGQALNDSQFAADVEAIVDRSFNIHRTGVRYVFKEDENPATKLKTLARNDKLFADGSDHLQLAREVLYVLKGDGKLTVNELFQVIVLPDDWQTSPWQAQPNGVLELKTEKLPVFVVPEPLPEPGRAIGEFVKAHLASKRNAVRWLLPAPNSAKVYKDQELLLLARQLKLIDTPGGEFSGLRTQVTKPLHDALKKRWTRFAVLARWDNQKPALAEVQVEAIGQTGDKILDAVDKKVQSDLFEPEDFAELLAKWVEAGRSVGDVLTELQEPRPGNQNCIAWIGDNGVRRKLAEACANGKLEINLGPTGGVVRCKSGESYEDALRSIEAKLPLSKALGSAVLQVPQPVIVSGGAVPTQPTVQPQVPTIPVGPYTPPTGPIGGGGGIFAPPSPTVTSLSAPATAPLNLRATVKDTWGVTAGSQLQDVVIRSAKLTGAQLDKLIKELPEGATFALDVKVEGPPQSGGAS